MIPKTRLCLVLLVLSFVSARGDDLSVNLLAPTSRQAAGTEITLDLLWLNQGPSPQRLTPPATIDATLQQSHTVWPVRLREAKTPAAGPCTLERAGFARRTYVVALPREATGTLVLSLEQPFSAQAVIDVAPYAAEATPARHAEANAAAPGFRPVASRLHRTVIENFGFHEPIYFLYGPDEPVAKFQFSFRYRLAGRRESPSISEPAAEGLYFAYTQRSLWNIKDPSSPFYDTSYMPELMFESLAPDRSDGRGLANFLGYQAGYRHESNGRDGLDSRSLNILYLRSGLLIGRRDGWRVAIVPRIFTYIGNRSDNSSIAEYRGYGELLVSVGRNDGIQVNVTGIAGRDWDKGSVQVDVTHPVKIPAVHLDTFLHFQYFDGYGESLRDYKLKSSTWRAGMSLVR